MFNVFMHPFLIFLDDKVAAIEQSNSFIERLVLHGWGQRAVITLSVEAEIMRFFNVLSYRHIFIVDESVYEELVCEFFTTYEYRTKFMSFRLNWNQSSTFNDRVWDSSWYLET